MITEGYFLKYGDVIWAVKGCYHPDGFAVAVPRVYKGRKIKKMSEGLTLVKLKFPNLFKYVDEIGFEVPLVPLNESEILDPFNVKKELPKVVYEFLNYFGEDVGITGSLLYSDTYNDLDFLSLNPNHYFILKQLREKGITSPLTFGNEEEVEILSREDFVKLKEGRLLEGVFQGIPYTFKIVECVDLGVVVSKKEFKGVVTISKAIKPFSLPLLYETEQGVILTSFRTRFSELKVGMRLYVDGILLERNKFLDLDLDIAKEVRVV